MRVHLSNLGCKLNQAEIEALGRSFHARGYRLVSSLDDADVHVINTCTVTHVADRTSRKLARRASKASPAVKTVLTGCYATASSVDAATLAGVDLVVDNDRKHRLVDEVEAAFPELAAVAVSKRELPYGDSALAAGRARAAVKIEDGCNMRCSFCIIPFTRGAQRSRPPQNILREIQTLVRGGLREIVLTGVQISSYRHGDLRLVDLAERVLEGIEGARLRLTSIAPWAFDRRLLGLLKDGSICPHVHLSLQAGCDAVLERMRRPYRVLDFERLVAEIRSAQPSAAITTDVIVGFPGETEAEFEQSLATVERVGFAKVHAFPYSRRGGTAADAFDQQIEPEVKGERMRRMLEVAHRAERQFQRLQLGRKRQVLWESVDDEVARGTSDNYLKVSAAPTPERRSGGLRWERVERGKDGELWAA